MTTQDQELHTKALEIACRNYNRVIELNEIVELFCLDAEAAHGITPASGTQEAA